MKILGIDVGSSSVKAAIVEAGTGAPAPVRVAYTTRREGTHVEVDPDTLIGAVGQAARQAV